jgi:hypothetical protein
MVDPLVPLHVDLRDFPFMPLDVARLRDSAIVDEVSGDEFRAAILLWCAAWHQVPAGSLPNDPKQLSKFAGYGRVVSEWEKVAAGALYGWVECSDGRLYHPVVAEKALEAWEKKLEFGQKSADRAERAKAAAEARWGKKDPGEPSTGADRKPEQADRRSEDTPMHEQCARMPDALPKYKGQGQGELRDKETLRSAREPRSRCPDEIEVWVRSLLTGEPPVIVDPDVTPIRLLLAEPGFSRADVEAGIAAQLARGRKPARSWADFEGWIRRAARDRLAAAPKSVRSVPPDAPTPLPDPVQFRRTLIARAADHFRGRWREVWPNQHMPDHPDCVLDEDVIAEARAIVAAEEASKSDSEAFARLRGFVPDRPRQNAA